VLFDSPVSPQLHAVQAPLAAHLLSAPASQAYVESVYTVCGGLTAGKVNRLTKNLESRAFLEMNYKYYAEDC
jgi:hypothetical protein